MASSYSPPDVIVTQKQRTVSAPRIQPTLPVVVVGPARQIEIEANAGVFTAGAEFEAAIPNLKPGALIDATTVEVLLDVTSAAGKALGLFRLSLSSPADCELVSDNSRIRVFSTLGLEYSLLSASNNDVDTTNNQVSAGTPDGIFLTDPKIDFLSRGAGVGDTFVNITSPASAIGRYRVTELIQANNAVNEVVLTKVQSGTSTAELTSSFTIAADVGGDPLANQSFIWGFSAQHAMGTVAYGPKVSEVTATYTNAQGVGIESILQTIPLLDITAICLPGGITMPNATSAAAQWFQPGVGAGAGEGRSNAAWVSLIAQVQVNNWLRFVGDFDGLVGNGTPTVRDYKVVGVDRVNSRVQLQNPDGLVGQSGTISVVANDLTNLYLLKVFQGYDDASNVAGDFIVGSTGAGIPFKNEIRRATPYLIELREDLPALGTTTTACALQRGIRARGVTVSYDLTKRLTSDFTGNVLMNYEAARVDLSVNGLIDVASQAEIEDKLGMIDPGNPIALGADMVNRSGLTGGGNIFYAIATDGETTDAFQAALDTLETTEQAYYIVPLTQDPAILDLFINHVTAQSQPLNKHELRCFISRALDIVDAVWPLTVDQAVPHGTVDGVDATKFASAEIDWSLVTAGDMVHILPSADITATPTVSLRIQTVSVAGGYIKTFDTFPSTVGASSHFKIETYPRSKQEQAELERDQAKGIGNQRVCMIRPDQIEISYTNKRGPAPMNTTVVVPAQYACAAFAGLRGAMTPQQPMTNMMVPGINRLVHGADYFTQDQLNTIAEGGNLILTQVNPNTPVTVRHQITTNMDSIQSRELSYDIIADYTAIVLRTGLRPYIGKHNITREFLIQLRHITETLIKGLIADGVLLPGTQIMTFAQNQDRPDEIDIEINAEIPLPVNRINITLYI